MCVLAIALPTQPPPRAYLPCVTYVLKFSCVCMSLQSPCRHSLLQERTSSVWATVGTSPAAAPPAPAPAPSNTSSASSSAPALHSIGQTSSSGMGGGSRTITGSGATSGGSSSSYSSQASCEHTKPQQQQPRSFESSFQLRLQRGVQDRRGLGQSAPSLPSAASLDLVGGGAHER